MTSTTSRLWWLLALAFSAILATGGVKGYKILSNKAGEQDAVTESVIRWKQNYLALAESIKRWDASYRREESIPDMLSLIAAVNLGTYGLASDPDTIMIQKIDQVRRGNASIGLSSVCLASAGAPGAGALEVNAPSYAALFAGLQRLAGRADVSIGSIAIRVEKGTPIGSLGDFCVLLSRR